VISLAKTVHDLLQERGQTVATAESLTGGRVAALLTEAPGASDTYIGGAVTYATEAKVGVLGVDRGIVDEHGVVSAECARDMARGVRELMGSTYAVSTTGVAGPDDQEGKPPGTVFVGVAGPEGVRAVELELDGDRDAITKQTCEEALSALLDTIRQEETSLG
jgi:nicotinamide-nucleotide amidase